MRRVRILSESEKLVEERFHEGENKMVEGKDLEMKYQIVKTKFFFLKKKK